MFPPNSRYANLPRVTATDAEGREVTAVKLRTLGTPGGQDVTIAASDQLDVISDQCFGDATRFWHVADANTDLDARDLTAETGRTIKVPER